MTSFTFTKLQTENNTKNNCQCATCSHMLEIVLVVWWGTAPAHTIWRAHSRQASNVKKYSLCYVECAHIQTPFIGPGEQKSALVEVEVSHLIPYLLKHSHVQHFLTVIFLICTCGVCLADLCLDLVRVENRMSPAFWETTRFISLFLSPVLRLLKSLQRETWETEEGENR